MQLSNAGVFGDFLEKLDQHKETRDSRRNRNNNDINKLVKVLEFISLFNSDRTLRNIITDIAVEEEINVDEFHVFS